jgi:hypothetical protein
MAAQGFWMRLLCIAAAHDPIGYVAVAGRGLDETSLALMTGCKESEAITLLGELERNGVFSRDRHGRIYNRRMIADAKKAAIAKKNGKNGGNPSLRKQNDIPASDKGQDKDRDKPHKPEATIQVIEPIAQHTNSALREIPVHLLDKLFAANGMADARLEKHPGLLSLAPILGLIEAGFDTDRDIIPGIASKPNLKARTWSYFVPQIRQWVEDRSAAASVLRPAPEQIDWAERAEYFYKSNIWGAWGPKPGERGCEMPEEFLREIAA